MVASSMEAMDKAPFAEVVSFDATKGHGKGMHYYNVKVEFWRIRVSEDEEPYKTLPGDLVLISDHKPETVSDLDRAGWNWALASVVSVTDDDGVSTTEFKVKMAVDFGAKIGVHSSVHIVFLDNITTSKRIWNALGMPRKSNIIHAVLYTSDETGRESCTCTIGSLTQKTEAKMLSKLNESQVKAVRTCLRRVECVHCSHVDLIWGPPSTGKTTTISTLLFMLCQRKCRTLVCAPTNVAISQVATRVIKLIQESLKDESSKKNLIYPLGDVLIFGEKDRLKLGEDFEESYLEYCVERLLECLKDWRHCVDSAIRFFEYPVSEHEIFVETELIKMRELIVKGETLKGSSEPKSFAEFIKSQFEVAVSPLRRCMLTMCTHLPRHFILEKTFQDILSLVHLLDSMKHTLYQKPITSEQLNEIFSQPVHSQASFGSTVNTPLAYLRKKILSILKSLLNSLGGLQFPNAITKTSITEFCLNLSSLVFCTSSSSYKMHSFEIKPFSLMVIDEAAQLRECESIIPLQLQGLKHAILVGDECQLPAIVHSKVSSEAGFGRSLFERLSSLGHSKLVLNMQYRMHPAISHFPNLSFYNQQVIDAPNVQSKTYARQYLQGRMFGPYSFISVPNGKEELDGFGHSRRNMVEVALVLKIVHNLYRYWRNTRNELSIGVISPYAAQVVAIKEKIGKRYDNLNGFAIKVKSIDGFQVTISSVSSRHCLWILGNELTLENSHSEWEGLVLNAKQRQCLFSASEDSDLSKTFLEVKTELNQLEDLLNADSILFKNQRWKVLLSEDFKRSFKKLVASHLKKAVLTLLLKLASGWRPKRKSMDRNCNRFKNLNERFAKGLNDSEVDGGGYIETSRVSESLLLMKFYSLSSGIANHLLSDNLGEEIDIPFEVSDEEREIIMFERSSFILGRSGTGKTTVLTMKMFQKEQQQHLALEGITTDNNEISKYTGRSRFSRAEITSSQSEVDTKTNTLRQLFVTVSPKLCYAVKQHISHLKCFAQGKKFSDDYGSLMDMVDDLDGLSHFKDIPNTFVSIPEKKYPLVITFRKFLMMLDGTVGSSYFNHFQEKNTLSLDISSSVTVEALIKRKEVNFDRFCCLYWPRFNSQLTKILDVAKVFTEIISHIKGAFQACEKSDAKLSRDKYISMSDKRISTLNEKKREAIYDIFLDYEKMKKKRGEFDLADLVNDIHLRLNEENWEGDKLDFVYIDEVQDLTMRQILLFKYVCQNVDEGFIFSGDTAQTIAKGVDFRFEDIRTLFYEEFVMKQKCGMHVTEKGHIAKVSCLLQNFRTHAGVLKLAQSVIDILYHYFPLSIDALAPETSLIYGEAPVLLRHGSNENVIATILGNRVGISSKVAGFGAEQVILVRDESVKKQVVDLVGKQALVLTILESKGLEFQDVLLYNFFSSSPFENQWRVVYEFMSTKQRDLVDLRFLESFPYFTEERHTVLCSELKLLYVAITRTRQRLWISESVEEFSKPMFEYWGKMGLVEVRTVDESFVQAMHKASTQEQWKDRGLKLLWEKNYEMAIMCFERAGERTLEKQAKAFSLREAAARMQERNPKVSGTHLREAAEIFESIKKFQSAAECYCDLKDFVRAGEIYLNMCGEHAQAAECFISAGCYETAAEIYTKQNCLSKCLAVCSKGQLYEKGLKYVEKWKPGVQYNDNDDRGKEIDRIKQEFLERCASKYFKCNARKSMMKFVKAFKSMDDKRQFLRTRNCMDELLLLEAELLVKAGNFCNATSQILSYVLANSLWVQGSEPWPLKYFASKNKLLNKATTFARNESDLFYESVCTEAKVLEHEKRNLCELRCVSS
ncbi:unnamed protein product [Cuscuta campestris]|uniref:UvrD-like helicase ATP-binding domain-containing protein n=1 Tax=Cuscuta campestris TaxID=132261 RepID=A0A484L8J4_9ASTE|nr:unnamed protein product [Cuscuta campestris]